MERHFFASDSLRDLEVLEMELEQLGVVRPQIHVLSNLDSCHFQKTTAPFSAV